jgi:hypothetical protein
MASNSLSGSGVSPANTKAQLLHIGTGNLAAGAVVRLGDGTATPVTISSAGITVDGAVVATSLTAASLTATGGSLAVTGGIAMTGLLVFSDSQALSGAGAIDPAKPTTLFTSTGASQALTLANGTNGQIKTIIHVVDGGSGVLTPSTKTGFSTITFTAAGDSATLQYLTTRGWIILGTRGVTVA